ncbi:MAG: aminoglycoside phosphotransferase family protein [Verrucomicrobiae bacterium]|nr:aminoglycoside phosphotransferase family protein [Verrucomicrobiae bacterium]
MSLRYVTTRFAVEGEFCGAEEWGSGHINDTYRASYRTDGGIVHYIHQRINHHVFRNPEAMMQNIARVTSHLQEKLGPEGARHALRLVPTREGAAFCRDEEGNYWRTYNFIGGARSYDTIETPQQAYEAARAFGEFQGLLIDFPPPRLLETIPDFHHTPKRFAALERAIEQDAVNRAVRARAEIEFAVRHKGLANLLLNANLPERVTHNDTKINNVLLDDLTCEAVCVIDLDTVMPGLALYDFGDMVRTATCRAPEDERDLAKVTVEPELFEAVARGYLTATRGFLTAAERNLLVASGKVITFEIGVRFLTDYLQGDVYFKVHRDGHNLDRCRSQFKLLQSIIDQEDRLCRMVERLAAELG